jgi:hypothetical protein
MAQWNHEQKLQKAVTLKHKMRENKMQKHAKLDFIHMKGSTKHAFLMYNVTIQLAHL